MQFWENIVSMTGLGGMEIGNVIMIALALFFIFLSVGLNKEPMLLLPLAFGILIANIPGAHLSAYDEGYLMHFLYGGIKYVIYPPLVFLCIGTMTDFGPLIASPKNALIGAGAQFGIFAAFGLALLFSNIIPGVTPFSLKEAGAIGIIGGADGPTAVFAASKLSPNLLSSIAIAAFSYMALVPFIQPPLMKAMTTAKERVVVMPEPKQVTKRQKIFFPIIVTLVTMLLVPTAGTLIGMLMLGNLIRESGVVERYVRSLQNDILNALTLLVGLSIGSSATAEFFLTTQTLLIIALGLLAFVFGTMGGILVAKLLYLVTGGKVNPLIGNAGVSAMPMAARISQRLGQRYNQQNYLLMHAMGALVSGIIGSSVAAGIFLKVFG